jgi:rubrerythrin
MTGVLIVAALAVLSLAYISGPLRKPGVRDEVDANAELEEQKRRALVAILELEDERDVGKLTDEDFADLRKHYEAEALEALHRLDGTVDSGVDDPLEFEIAKVRQRLAATRCPNCGEPRARSEERCPRCGV